MIPQALRPALTGFHLTLGLVVLYQSAHTTLHALQQAGGPDTVLAILAGVETLGAVLFLLPSPVRVGGTLLLLTFAVALLLHGLQGEFHETLLIYAAGVILIMVARPGRPFPGSLSQPPGGSVLGSTPPPP